MNEGTLAEKLRSIGIDVFLMDERETGVLGIFSRVRCVLHGWQPDVLHTHREKENVIGCLANRASRNVASVRTVHGDKEHSVPAGWHGVRRHLIDLADRWCGRMLQQRFIAVTRELAEKLTHDFPADKVVVIENGVDLEAVTLAKGLAAFKAVEPNATHVGIAGRLVQVKRGDLFIEAAALLLRECPERHWRFHIFGDGPTRQALEALSERLQLADKVKFHGERTDIATCIGGLDVLVICSDHEGMPMISLEAAALGVPTVGHAVGGLVDVVPEEFLVVQHDAYGYKEGILRLLRADARTITAKRAAETAVKFSASRNAEIVRALYEEVLTERDGRGAKWKEWLRFRNDR
jgi:glycosyltransferase involved in cell wall biosynthesis